MYFYNTNVKKSISGKYTYVHFFLSETQNFLGVIHECIFWLLQIIAMFPFQLFKRSGEEQTTTSEKVEDELKMEETKKEEEKKEKNALAQQKERQIRDVISIALGH